MKKALCAVAIVVLSVGALLAQDITGQWQGTLALGQGLRTIITVSRDPRGELQGVMYSIDQSPQPVAVGGITVQGATVKMSMPAIAATFEGRFNVEGNTMIGAVTQAGKTTQLNLTRATPSTAWAIPDLPARLKPMAATVDPAFAVATIKPTPPDTRGKLFGIRPGQFTTVNTSLVDMITFAYGLHPKQITNGPSWIETEMYNITGKPDGEGQPSTDQWKAMLKKLLAERFKLTFHQDKKELPVYSLVVAKNGAKVVRSQGDPDGPGSLLFRGLGNLPVQNARMSDFASVMQAAVLDRPVVDNTQLVGRYDFALLWTPDESQFRGLGVNVQAPKDDPAAPPDLFTAIQEQAGLRLEATRAPVDVIVIDTVDHPTQD
jgi:bla regulator protein blaR1